MNIKTIYAGTIYTNTESVIIKRRIKFNHEFD